MTKDRPTPVIHAAIQAVLDSFADGRNHGKQPGEWAGKGPEEHVDHAVGHARAALVTEGAPRRLHLRHLICRAGMALCLLEEGQ